MGRKRGRDKKEVKEERRRIEALVMEAFQHFNANELYEEKFVKYFQKRGMSRDEIDRLWVRAMNLDIIRIEAEPIWEPGKPWNILGQKTVFVLVKGEEE
jgi:3-oxoacyl-[acyl-carrier-protein] synthase III